MPHPVCPRCGLNHIPTKDGRCPLHGDEAEAAAAEPVAPAAPEVPEMPLSEPEATEPPSLPPAEPEATELPEVEATPPPSMLPGEPVPALTATPTPPPLAPAPTPPPVQTSPPVLADGQARCPHCGEALYAGEQVCWNCSKRVDEVTPPGAPPTGSGVVTPPPAGARIVPPTPAPLASAPPAGAVTAGPEPVKLGWDDAPPADAGPAPSPEALRLAYWSLGLGLAGTLTCGGLSILGPIGLWLGIKATREQAGPVGVAGLILGAIATLLLIVVGTAFIIMIASAASSIPSESLLPVPALPAYLSRMVATMMGVIQ